MSKVSDSPSEEKKLRGNLVAQEAQDVIQSLSLSLGRSYST